MRRWRRRYERTNGSDMDLYEFRQVLRSCKSSLNSGKTPHATRTVRREPKSPLLYRPLIVQTGGQVCIKMEVKMSIKAQTLWLLHHLLKQKKRSTSKLFYCIWPASLFQLNFMLCERQGTLTSDVHVPLLPSRTQASQINLKNLREASWWRDRGWEYGPNIVRVMMLLKPSSCRRSSTADLFLFRINSSLSRSARYK